MSDIIALRAIGRVVGGRREAIDDDWDKVEAVIALDPVQFGSDATAGLGDFSHIEVVFHFDRVGNDEINTGARHPRGRRDWPLVGIFAQRGKARPIVSASPSAGCCRPTVSRFASEGSTPSTARPCSTSSRS